MDKLFLKLGGGISNLFAALEEAGCLLRTWYEAVEYNGPFKQLEFQLRAKRGFFTNERIAAGDDAESLREMAGYINTHPECKKWKLSIGRCQNAEAQNGDFMIVEKMAFRGGEREGITNIVRSFGGDQDDIDCILDETGERTLGYLLSVGPREAQALAEIIHMGATTPVSPEEILAWLASMRQSAKARVAAGDISAEPLVGAWEKIAKRWQNHH